jgi:phosphoribosylformylglycinamidine synthase
VLEAARNVIAAGAQPIGITNCLNWQTKSRPHVAALQSIDGMCEALRELDLPVTGGNVSLYNESLLPDGTSLAILPTPVIGMLGLLEDWRKAVRGNTNREGVELFLLGTAEGRLDGSALCFDLGRLRAGELGVVDYRQFRSCEAPHRRSQDRRPPATTSATAALRWRWQMYAAGDIELGGPGRAALPDCYDSDANNALGALFAEDGQRWIIAVDAEHRGWLRTAALHYNVALTPLGTSGGGRLRISAGDKTLLDEDIAALRDTHANGLAKLLG